MNDQIRRGGDRRRRGRAERGADAGAVPAVGAGDRRGRPAQRAGRRRARPARPGRHAAGRVAGSRPGRGRAATAARSSSGEVDAVRPRRTTGSRCGWPTAGRSRARRLLVATGLVDELPDVPGLARALGPRRPALPVLPRLGGPRPGRSACWPPARWSVHQALLFRQLTDDVTFFTHGTELPRRIGPGSAPAASGWSTAQSVRSRPSTIASSACGWPTARRFRFRRWPWRRGWWRGPAFSAGSDCARSPIRPAPASTSPPTRPAAPRCRAYGPPATSPTRSRRSGRPPRRGRSRRTDQRGPGRTGDPGRRGRAAGRTGPAALTCRVLIGGLASSATLMSLPD